MTIRYILMATLLLAAPECPTQDKDLAEISTARKDGNFQFHTVRSAYQSGTTKIRVLLPDDFDKKRRYRILYVLPVEALDGKRWGNGLEAVRKAGLGLMMNVPGDAKPLPYVEDTAVAPEVLPEFVKRFDEIVKNHGTEAGYYGHASVGCLHIRPLIDLKRQDGVDRMVAIAEEISDLVLEFGGSMSGEHGDGLVDARGEHAGRSCFRKQHTQKRNGDVGASNRQTVRRREEGKKE